jgi:hypothetical protein
MEHTQYSMFSQDSDPAVIYLLVLRALRLPPLGCFASAMQAFQMYGVPDPEMLMTAAFRLGGAQSPQPLGPTPAGLAPPGVGVHPAVAPLRPPLVRPVQMLAHQWVVAPEPDGGAE